MVFLSIVVLHVLLSLHSEAFNVDDQFPIRFSSSTANNYFGYTVTFLNNNQGKWIIVGAPRANSTYGGREGIYEPGEIYKCKVDSSSRTCSQIQFGSENSGKPNERLREDNGWLGVSIDVSDDTKQLVACGHLVKNSIYQPIGVCYSANTYDLNQRGSSIRGNTRNRLEEIGISAQFLKASTSLIVAASLSILPTVNYIETNANSNIWRHGTHYSYSGYAITSGNIFSQAKVQVVIGAPRDHYIGTVYIQQDGDQASALSLSGKQIGEYFGAALCAVDLDKDGWDDLVVGAPLHSTDCDEGKVYVFKNLKNKKMILQKEITGSEISARFGSSIAAIGDIDLDGFQDIAIGAPYENNGKGAVYIYYGSPQGINPKYQQKIIAKGSARGFGISIAGGMDIDANKYPDIAIGAYGSGEVFIHRTRPAVNVQATMTTNKAIIDADGIGCMGKNLSCYQLTVCFQASTKTEVIRRLTVDILMGDVSPSSRAFIIVGEYSRTNNITSTTALETGKSKCDTTTIFVSRKPTNYFTPIQMQLAFKLKENTTPTFCSSCSVLNPSTRTEIVQEVRFKTKCNGTCNADLSVEAWILDFENSSLVIGSTKQISLKVNVFNLGDDAYITDLTIDTPSWMTFDNIPTNCHTKSPLYCDVANILETRENSILEFTLNVENAPIIEEGKFNITCIAASQSKEKNNKDNVFLVEVPIKSVSDIFILGSTNDEQMLYDRKKVHITEGATVNFSHVFHVGNAGPTALQTKLQFELLYPAFIGDSNEPIIQVALNSSVPVSCKADFISQHVGIQEANSHDAVEATTTSSHVTRREIKNEPKGVNRMQGVKSIPANVAILNCSTATCKIAICTIASLRKDDSVTLSFTFIVRLKSLVEHMREKDSVVIVSEARLDWDQRKEHQPQLAKVMTEIKPGVPRTPPVDTWIIAASVVGGLIAFALLILILWKLGFFKRPKKEKMKRLTRNIECLIEPDTSNTET